MGTVTHNSKLANKKNMDPHLKLVLDKFLTELKKDIHFFGGCGFTVALFMIWQTRLQELGVAKNPHWANELFTDFVSFNAFGLIFFGYLLLACIVNISIDLGYSLPKLTSAVTHMESRLMQIASSIIAFMVGLFTLIFIYSFLNFDRDGFDLLFLAVCFVLFIIGTLVAAVLIGQRAEPYNIWWVSLIVFVLSACVLTWLLIQSGK